MSLNSDDPNKTFYVKPILQDVVYTKKDLLQQKTYEVKTNSNTSVGTNSGNAITSGNSNILLGSNSGELLTSGSKNILIGYNSGAKLTANSENVFVGHNSGKNVTSGINNTLIGYSSGESLTTGSSNTLLGFSSGDSLTSGSSNTLIGYQAGESITTSSNNILVGSDSGKLITTGTNNVMIGISAGSKITTGNRNTLVGNNSGENLNSTSSENVFVGFQAGQRATTSIKNTLIGYNTGNKITSGGSNTILGYNSGKELTTGQNNILIGSESGNLSVTNSNNIIVGNNSAGKITLSNNVIIGSGTGANITTGQQNVVIGNSCVLVNNIGDSNTVIGNNSGSGMTGSVTKSTLLGSNADSLHENTIILGYGATSNGPSAFFLPNSTFLVLEQNYGPEDVNGYNAYDCSVKYNSITGQVVLKQGESSKPLFTRITNEYAGENSSIALNMVNEQEYLVETLSSANDIFTIFLPNTIRDGHKCKLIFQETTDRAHMKIISGDKYNNKLVGKINVMNRDSVFTVGIESVQGTITSNEINFLYIKDWFRLLPMSYVNFEFIDSFWYFEGTFYTSPDNITNLNDLKVTLFSND